MVTDEYAIAADGTVVWIESEEDFEYLREVAKDNTPESSEWE